MEPSSNCRLHWINVPEPAFGINGNNRVYLNDGVGTLTDNGQWILGGLYGEQSLRGSTSSAR